MFLWLASPLPDHRSDRNSDTVCHCSWLRLCIISLCPSQNEQEMKWVRCQWMTVSKTHPQIYPRSQSKQKNLPVDIYFQAKLKFTFCFICVICICFLLKEGEAAVHFHLGKKWKTKFWQKLILLMTIWEEPISNAEGWYTQFCMYVHFPEVHGFL